MPGWRLATKRKHNPLARVVVGPDRQKPTGSARVAPKATGGCFGKSLTWGASRYDAWTPHLKL